MRTPGQRLADIHLNQPVEDWIAERRNQNPRQSWRRISLELRDVTHGEIDVTPGTLIAWDAARSDDEPVSA